MKLKEINFVIWRFHEYILTGKRNATIKFCRVRRVVHEHELHELTMTRTLSKASGLFEFIDFSLLGMLAID